LVVAHSPIAGAGVPPVLALPGPAPPLELELEEELAELEELDEDPVGGCLSRWLLGELSCVSSSSSSAAFFDFFFFFFFDFDSSSRGGGSSRDGALQPAPRTIKDAMIVVKRA
jgi:hypothetical protein